MKESMFLNLLLLIFSLIQTDLSAQERIIHGNVTTFENIFVVNASIQVKSTKQFVISDSLGRFSVWCNTEDKLTVSAKGFFNQSIKVDDTNDTVSVDLLLKSGEKNIKYAIGYGHVEDRDKLYAMSQLEVGNNNFSNYRTMYDLINGRFSGVQIINGEIIIRGRSTFANGTTSGAALIIIDGMQGDESTLFNISPHDVQSINVMKDGSAAIYGSRGANGVVLVETKRGKAEKE